MHAVASGELRLASHLAVAGTRRDHEDMKRLDKRQTMRSQVCD